MSTQLAERPTTTDRVAKWIRRLCVPIVLFWVAVAALSNVLVPQLEVVGEEQNVALSAPDSPSLQAFQRIGKVFDEFDSDSAAMVVLEGDATARRRSARLLRRVGQAVQRGHQTRPARAGLLGRPADRRGLAESRRQGRLRCGVPRRQSGRGVVVGVGQRAARHHRQDAGTARYPRLRRRFGCAGHRQLRGGQRQHRVGHDVDRRRDRIDVADRLPLVRHHDPGAHHGAHRDVGGARDRLVPGEHRRHRPVDVCDQHADASGPRRRNRLHHLPAGSLSRETQRRHGPRGRLLRHVSRDVARDLGVGADHRRRGGLPVLHPVGVFLEPGHPGRHRCARRAGRLADAGARGGGDRRPLRIAGAQAQDRQTRLAADRDGDRPVARADPDRHAGARLRRTGVAVRLQGELRHQPVHAGRVRRRMWDTPQRSGTSRRRG